MGLEIYKKHTKPAKQRGMEMKDAVPGKVGLVDVLGDQLILEKCDFKLLFTERLMYKFLTPYMCVCCVINECCRGNLSARVGFFSV